MDRAKVQALYDRLTQFVEKKGRQKDFLATLDEFLSLTAVSEGMRNYLRKRLAREFEDGRLAEDVLADLGFHEVDPESAELPSLLFASNAKWGYEQTRLDSAIRENFLDALGQLVDLPDWIEDNLTYTNVVSLLPILINPAEMPELPAEVRENLGATPVIAEEAGDILEWIDSFRHSTGWTRPFKGDILPYLRILASFGKSEE